MARAFRDQNNDCLRRHPCDRVITAVHRPCRRWTRCLVLGNRHNRRRTLSGSLLPLPRRLPGLRRANDDNPHHGNREGCCTVPALRPELDALRSPARVTELLQKATQQMIGRLGYCDFLPFEALQGFRYHVFFEHRAKTAWTGGCALVSRSPESSNRIEGRFPTP